MQNVIDTFIDGGLKAFFANNVRHILTICLFVDTMSCFVSALWLSFLRPDFIMIPRNHR